MKTSAAILAATLLAATAQGAAAQQVKLRIADSFPAGHYIVEYGTKLWMDEVAKASGGKAAFEYYPAEQLGKAKDLLSLTQSGVVDVGYVAPSFVTDKLPLGAVAELPESFSSACAGTMAYWKLARPGGLLAQREFEPAGMRVLWALVLTPYQLYMAKEPITTLKALEGRKIRTSGAAKELAIRKMNAIPVQIPTPDVMEALTRGTVDGMLFPHSSILSYDLQGRVKHATIGENLGSFVVTYMISNKRFNELPPEVRKAMDDVADKVVRNACENTDRDEARDIERIKAAGVTMTKLPDAEHKALEAMMASVGREWAANLDKRNKAGSEILAAFQEALKTAK
ncbi:MAG TPA: TRAP transporter substrate-binding protein DctP [Azospirillum sp.]|nr:TRAP transporter substrate-binding protein DctP [Azospirillum sp.]